VQQFGGQLAIYSTPGVGTTVRVLLPQETDLRPGRDDGRLAAATGRAAGRETILLAEDDDDVRELTARMLRDAGYTVVQARDGTEAARALARRADIDMLVTDVIMPGLDGPQLAERLAERDARLPVLFTSAYTRGLITHQGLLDPAVAYLEKPFTTASLTQKVRAALDSGRPARDPSGAG
jgi:CheY-like chemotaxis protein